MPFIDPTQKEIRDEQKAYLKDKSFKYKFDYFLTYYLKGLIIIAVCAGLLIAMIVSIVTKKDTGGHVIMVNSMGTFDEEAFAAYAGIDTEEYDMNIETGCRVDREAADSESYTNLQRILAIISAGDLDCLIGDKDTIYAYCESDFFGDLRDYFSQEELDALGDKVIYYQPLDDDDNPVGSEIPVLIDISDSPKLAEGYNYYSADEPVQVVYGIITNTKRSDVALKFYEYIMN